MRKLASVRKIDNILPISGADAIEVAIVGGWSVVVRKGEYVVGDLAVYLEIDSWVPEVIAPFLCKGVVAKEFNGIVGERLKTIKLRGTLSQGLLISLESIAKYIPDNVDITIGSDVSKYIGVQKWEPLADTTISGSPKGSFPGLVPKTDQERIQNIGKISARMERI